MTYIAFTLSLPIFDIICWACISTIMSMPKTTVNKYGDFFVRKYKIWMSFNLIISSPTDNTVFFKNFN